MKIEPTIERIGDSLVLYDASQLSDAKPELFRPDYWRGRGQLEATVGGRGAAWFVGSHAQPWVLRHYQRGGMVAKLSRDRYLFWGQSRVRAVAEWRLLVVLFERDLPVPRPVAARYQRRGLTYVADILLTRLPETQPLSAVLAAAGAAPWRAIGACIRAFHNAGVDHPDLNAHNVLLGSDQVYLVDFDRAALRQAGNWRDANLKRLLRSLHKIAGAGFEQLVGGGWEELLKGYAAGD